MTETGLLKSCLNYFNQAQLSWDRYFSKWEVMAQEENVDDLDKDFLSFKEVERKVPKKRKSVTRKRHIKSVAKPSRKNNTGKEVVDKKRKKVHCKTSNPERGNEIIHKTENQTNLECEVVNNKHFEADLKAIFIEILSENTNKLGMFSVLSRMFPGNGNTISNISLSSVIMERNEFSINPISNIILHSSPYNEFLLRGISPCRLACTVSGRKCSSVGFHNMTQTANESEVNLCGRDNLPCLNDSYVKHPRRLFHIKNWFGKINEDKRDSVQVSDVVQILANESPRYLEGKSTISSPICNRGSIYANIQQSKTYVERMNQSIDGEINSLTSPKATLRKILSPTQIGPEPPRSYHQNRKRKRVNSISYDSYDDNGDEKNNCNTDDSPGRFIKIFCTSKTQRRINFERNDSTVIAEDPDDEDCIDIVDRVKNTGT